MILFCMYTKRCLSEKLVRPPLTQISSPVFCFMSAPYFYPIQRFTLQAFGSYLCHYLRKGDHDKTTTVR